MKRIIAAIFFLTILAAIFPSFTYASPGLIKPDSKLYFLQSWGETLRLFLTFSKEEKINYLLKLTDRRVSEMADIPTSQIGNRYEEHFRELNQLANQGTAAKIRETSLYQQKVLAQVYIQVPEKAKEAIINAQENSSKHVAQIIERNEGAKQAEAYIQRVERIQQMEKLGQAEKVEPVQMEGSPNADPSQNVPRELKENKGLLPGQNLQPLNPALEGQGGAAGEGRMEPAAPAGMNAPAGQN